MNTTITLSADIYIHTNKLFDLKLINYTPYENGKISLIKHNLFKYSLFKGKITILLGQVESYFYHKKSL